MSAKKPPLSIPSFLIILLTLCVLAGGLFLLASFHADDPDAQMPAQRIAGVIANALHGPTLAPTPQSTVKTVVVTLAPSAAAPTVAVSPTPRADGTSTQHSRYAFSMTIGGAARFESDISDAAYDKINKTFAYQPILSALAGKTAADLNLLTLSNVLNINDHKYADVIAPESVLDAVAAGGFDAVLLNTEHCMDQGARGALDTVAAIQKRGMSCLGINAASCTQHALIQLNGARLALLTYTDSITNKGKTTLAQQSDVSLTLFDAKRAAADIQTVRQQGASCVIVFMHWGAAEASGVTKTMRERAKELAAAGADIVLGVHPTRVLPLEYIETRDVGTARKTLVAYSLGTLLGESREGYDISGLLLHLNIVCTENGVMFERVEYTPTYIWRQAVAGKTIYRVLCSADEAPKEMNDNQRAVMSRALKRIQDTMKKTPAAQRK